MADDLPKATEALAAPAIPEVTDVAEQKIDEEHESKKGVKELMDEGNADLALGKYSSACELFSLAVEKLVEQHGEMSVETVDALEVYGNALLKNAIASSAVLGGDAAGPKVDTAEPAAKKSVDTASSKAGPSSETITPQNMMFHFGGDEPDEEEDDGDDDDEAGEPEEETDDFENAWEILDSCRAILIKEESKTRKLQLARVHSSMAEVATESGRPEDGVKEYEQALAIQSSLLPSWDRLLAQTHLYIALALELVPTNTFDSAEEEGKAATEAYAQATEHVEKAKAILRAREAHIKGLDVDAGKGKGKEGEAVKENGIAEAKKELSEKDVDELKDIEELLVELDNKIEDLKAQGEEAATKAKEGGKKLQEQIFQAGPALPDDVSREVHNLNSLVKKKKKPTPAAAPTATAAATASSATAGTQDVSVTEDTTTPITNGKRKAEDEASSAETNGTAEPVEKKVRIEEPASAL